MGKAKQKPVMTAETLRPYIERAIKDPELRDDLAAAFVAARGLYEQVAKGEGVKGKAETVTDKSFQSDLQQLVAELTDASDRIQGKAKKKGRKARNRIVLLTGVTIGLLYNPWTGQATRDWIMEQIAGNGDSEAEDVEAQLETEAVAEPEGTAPGNGSEP